MEILKIALIIAGIAQLFIAVAYPMIRHKVLFWFEDLKNLNPLNEAIAKTYGYYIQGINFMFGLLSITLFQQLLESNPLSMAVVGFIAVYWIGRISFQLKDYSFKSLSNHIHFKKGIWGMNILITYLAATYTITFIHLIIQFL